MIEKEINNNLLLKPTFISRFNLSHNEIYSKERYLTVIMRTSIIEKLFTKFFFQTETKNFDLYPLIENLKKKDDLLKKFQERLNLFHGIYKKGEPLYLLSEVSDEISKLLKEDLSNIKIDKFIIKIEYLLSQHFENNFFYEYQVEQQINNNFFNVMYLQKEITNFNYSIESLNSIFKFLKIFEKQSLSTKIENEFPLINNYFCSEKIYYFYCDKLGREKRPSGNIIHYLLSQLFSKFDLINNAKVNNPQLENYLLLNLFMIDKIISDYSFYLTKKPELTDIFDRIKQLKLWPIPIGNKCVDTLDNIINECSFQGITILNKIRERYFIDFLDDKVQSIETKYFIGCIFLINNEWNEKHYDSIRSENPDDFNLIKFIERIINKKRNKHTNKFNLRELVLKILITIIFNSYNMNYNDEILRNIYQKYLPKYKNIYKQRKKKLNKPLIESDNNNNLIDDSDEEENQQSNIKKSLDKLLKIIDFGFDELIEEFSDEINIIAEKLIKENTGSSDLIDEEEEETILNCDAFLPITSLRNYLKPTFLDMKKLFKINDKNDESEIDLFNYYKNSFEFIVKNYYSKFLIDYNDELLNDNNNKLRKNFYFNYKINIILIEDKNSISYFIENLNKKVYNKLEEKITDEDFSNFWKYFIEKKSDFKINYLLHIVPHYENYNENPFKIIEEEENFENFQNYLSEYIASNDPIYKNLVFMPFASNSDPTFFSYIPNCQNSEKDVLEFPSLDCMYSFLKKPLDYYISDSNGILELNLHKIIINNDEDLSKIFYKNIELISTDMEIKSILALYGVNYLGIEDKIEEKIEINMDGPFMIKVFNIFFKKDIPFNYNMQSNPDWIEVFLNDKYDKSEVDKYCNYSSFIINNKHNKYYEEFNIPQTNFQPIFKNFKVKKLELSINKPTLQIKYDDNQIFNYQDNIKDEPKNKNFKIDILISKLEKDNEIQKIPIATFISI